MNRLRNAVILLIVLVGIVGFAIVYGRRTETRVHVATQLVHRTTFEVKLPENGVIQHPRAATVPTLIAGNIDRIFVQQGETVSAGEIMATVRNPSLESTAAGSQADYSSAVANIESARVNEQNARVTYQANVETARSNLDEARRVYRSDLSLLSNRAIPRNQVDTDRAKLEQAQVQYDQAVRQLQLGAVSGYGQNSVQYAQANAEKAKIVNQANQEQLGFTEVRAPFLGVVQSIAPQSNDPLTTLRAGDPVQAGQAIFTIAERANYIVKAQVDEQDVVSVRAGQTARVTSEDFPGRTLIGHVVAVAPVAVRSSDTSNNSKQVLTTIRLDSSPSFLKDGMSVDVDILTQQLRNAITVPNAAIQRDGSSTFVYVVRGGVARREKITTGTSNDTETIVRSGLAPGDRIVIEKNPALTDGAAVQTT